MKINYEDKYFLVSFEYDHSWSCVSIEAFRTGKVRNLDKNNNTAEIRFNKSWYLCRIHSSANDIESILRRKKRLSNSDKFTYFTLQSDDELDKNQNTLKKNKIGMIIFFLISAIIYCIGLLTVILCLFKTHQMLINKKFMNKLDQ